MHGRSPTMVQFVIRICRYGFLSCGRRAKLILLELQSDWLNNHKPRFKKSIKANHCRRRVSSRFNWWPRRRCKWSNFCSSWWIWFLSSSGSFLNFKLIDWLTESVSDWTRTPSEQHQFKSLSQKACANQGAKIYAPETKLQRTATMAWYQQFISVSPTVGVHSVRVGPRFSALVQS